MGLWLHFPEGGVGGLRLSQFWDRPGPTPTPQERGNAACSPLRATPCQAPRVPAAASFRLSFQVGGLAKAGVIECGARELAVCFPRGERSLVGGVRDRELGCSGMRSEAGLGRKSQRPCSNPSRVPIGAAALGHVSRSLSRLGLSLAVCPSAGELSLSLGTV